MPEEFLAPIHRKKIRHRQVSLAAAHLGCVICCVSLFLCIFRAVVFSSLVE